MVIRHDTDEDPAPSPEPVPTGERPLPSVIGATVVMRGELILDEDLIIDGQFSGGEIRGAHRMSIGKRGRVEAHVLSDTLDIHGAISGDCDSSDTVILRRGARIKGTVTAAELQVEDGSNLKDVILSGRIRRVE